VKKWAKEMSKLKYIQKANKDVKRCSSSFDIRELQIKTMRYYYTPIRMATIQKTESIKC
jgi:hypothetical protein